MTSNVLKFNNQATAIQAALETPNPKGNNLRDVRKSLGMTLDQASSVMGVAKGTLLCWEKGYKRPQRNNWVRMCEVYRQSSVAPVWKGSDDILDIYKSGHYPPKHTDTTVVTREVIFECKTEGYRIVKETF